MKKILGHFLLLNLFASLASAAPAPGRKLFPKYSRSGHTSTTLMTGEVLIVGGGTSNYEAPFHSVESYNPATQEWSEKAPLNSPRSAHQAVLLQDGSVLAIGGHTLNAAGDWIATTSIESYDPLLNTWIPKAPLLVARFNNRYKNVVATRLKDNRVLILGGEDERGVFLNSVEIFDPATNSAKLVAPLNNEYQFNTTTLLQDGTVLALGPSRSLPISAEIYDPVTNIWTVITPPTVARSHFTATLLPNGKVLVASGIETVSTKTAVDSAELFDPSTRLWSNTGALTEGRSRHTATLTPEGNVIVVGGIASTDLPTSTAEIYITSTGKWAVGSPMHSASYSHTADVSDNKLFIFGGSNSASAHSTHFELFDFTTQAWRYTDPPALPRFSHSATLLANGDVLLAGGVFKGLQNNEITNAVEIYHPSTNSISTEAPLLNARVDHAAVRLNDGKVLFIGGVTNAGGKSDALDSVELYDPVTKTSILKTPMHYKRHWFTATLLADGRVLVIGGAMDQGRKQPTDSVEIYDPLLDVWTHGTPLSVPRLLHTATLLPDGKVLVIGGVQSSSGNCSNLVELYDPLNYTWTTAAPLLYCRDHHFAHLMPDGKVLVLAGTGMNEQGKYTELKSVLTYDPGQNAWLQKTPFSESHNWTANSVLSGSKVLILGGDGDKKKNSVTGSRVEIYDYTADLWTSQPELYDRRSYASATLLANGKVLIHGGKRFEFGLLPFHELLTP